MSAISGYLSPLLPVPIGIGVMLLLTRMHARRKIRVELPGRERFQTAELDAGRSGGTAGMALEETQYTKVSSEEDEEGRTPLASEARERLIAAGEYGREARSADLSTLALSRLGMIGLEHLGELRRGRALRMGRKLTVFAVDLRDLDSRLCRFGPDAGLMLAYLIDSRLGALTI